MPIYQIMIESFSDAHGTYTPGVAWLYDPKTSDIRIDWLPGYDDRGMADQARVAGARADGWHGADIWAYYTTPQSYNGYVTVRSTPEPLIAPNMQTAAESLLRRMATDTPRR